MLRKIIACVLMVTVTWPSSAFAASLPQSSAVSGPLAGPDARQHVDRYMRLLTELRSHIDRSQFDLDALLDELDYDPETIIQFVSDDIAFEQYPGLLRGAEGTLMSRAGNALDQSVLLAKLLKDAGVDARIARATLSAQQARRLVDRMFLPRPPEPPIGDVGAMNDVLRKLGVGSKKASGDSPSAELDRFSEVVNRGKKDYVTAKRTAADFQRRLKKAGIGLGDPEIPANVVADARDYFWVEYRLGAGGAWRSVHPAFGDQGGPDVRPSTTIEDRIPEELQQRVRFEVEIEQQTAGRLERMKVMSGWERPAANLVGMQMRYMNIPDGLQSLADLAHPDEVARRTRFFVPVFNGALAPGAQLFDLDGVTAPPEAASSPASGVVRTVGEKTESAAEALSGLGSTPAPGDEPKDIRSLTGAWLIYSLIVPGREERHIRRTLYDAIGDNRRKDGQMAGAVAQPELVSTTWDLARNVTFMVSVCDYPRSYVLDRTLEQMISLRPLLDASLPGGMQGNDAKSAEDVLKTVKTSPEFTLFPAVASMDPGGKNVIGYETTPSILSTWSEIKPQTGRPDVQTVVDVVAQGRQAWQKGSLGPLPAVHQSMLSGVWESEVEQLVPPPASGQNSHPRGAPQMLEDARLAGVGLRVIAPHDSAAVERVSLPVNMKASMKAALAEGYAIIAPKRMTSGMFPGWWRIDPKDGSTLGMGPDGRGSAVEYAENELLISLGFFLGAPVVGGLASFGVCAGIGCSLSTCLSVAAKAYILSSLISAAIFVISLEVGIVSVGVGAAAIGEPAALPIVLEIGAATADIVHAEYEGSEACGEEE